LSKTDPEFDDFLKASLDSVIASSKKSRLWAVMSAEHVEIHNIRIPRLPHPQIANAVYWTLKKNAPFDEQQMLVDFEVQQEILEQGIPKLAVMACVAPRQEIEDVKALFAKTGHPLAGISIAPFALQSLLRRGMTDERGKIITILNLGNDSSRIDIYASGNLVMTRGIKAGTNSMVEALVDSYNDSRPYAPSLTLENGREMLNNLFRNPPPVPDAEAGFKIDEDETFKMIHSALERMVRQIDMTFKYFASERQQEKIAKIFVSSEMSVYKPILDYIGSNLDIACEMLDPLTTDHSMSVRFKEGDDAYPVERAAFATALGGALSDNDHSPNFLFTFQDKEREASVKKINKGVFAVFIAAVLVLGAFFVYQNHDIDRRQTVLTGLEKTLAGTGPEVDQRQLLKMAGQAARQRNISVLYAERYLGMALLGEVATVTPPNILLTSLKMKMGQAVQGKTVKMSTVSLDGLILGERQISETSLAGYVMSLEASPLFSSVSVEKSGVDPDVKDGELYFTLNLKVEG
jgi:Tfp pilus assembly PilM family ATPase/Tfp pilus assembly protein PilN